MMTLPMISGAAQKNDEGQQEVVIENEPGNPVPTVQVGRIPFQQIFDLSDTGSGSSPCDEINVPEEMLLTITFLGYRASSDGSTIPTVNLAIIRAENSGASTMRFGPAQSLTSTGPSVKRYQAASTLEVFVGQTTDPNVSYLGQICVSGPSVNSNSTYHNADGVISGYLTPALIVDGS